MIKPAPGFAFVIEDSENYSNLEEMGIQMPEEALRGVGSTGTVFSITSEQTGALRRIRHWLFADRIFIYCKKGDRVIFDKFVASDIYFRKPNGEEIRGLKSVPIDCILGTIED